jgi:exodeoxyribonuclease-5
MKLNDQQQQAYEKLTEFVNAKTTDKMFCLKGYAGTGKTYLISRFIEEYQKKNRYKKVAMTAPTNKAVQVLRESSNLKDVTYKTIHSLLGLKENITDSGEIEFTRDWNLFSNETGIKQFKILIVDEVSMLSDELFFHIRRYNNQVKIILMGDPAQIPPVGKEDCEPFLNPEQHGIIEVQLTQIMRQGEGSTIVEASFDIRENLSKDKFRFLSGIDLNVINLPVQRPLLVDRFTELFSGKINEEVRVIAWTNRKVSEYNSYIRSLTFPDVTNRYVVSERLIMNKPYVVVVDMDDITLTSNQEIEIKELKTSTNDDGICVYVATCQFTDKQGKIRIGELDLLHESSDYDFNHQMNELKQEAIRCPQSERKERWAAFYKFIRSVADVSYAYAITAHKSQGSTYGTCVVDMKNIELNDNVIERNRILYTAMTRAKNELILIQ